MGHEGPITSLGRHLLLEMWGCGPGINSADEVRKAIVEAVSAIGATLLNLNVHSFSPQGVTGLAVLAESHLSVHTWPEHGYIAADVFTCGETARPREAIAVFQRVFCPRQIEVQEISRGIRPPSEPRTPSESPDPSTVEEIGIPYSIAGN